MARGQSGVSQRLHVGIQRSHPPDTPHRTAGTVSPGSAGVPPASSPFGRRPASVRCCRQPPCRREQQRPGRRRAMAPFPVDSSGRWPRLCRAWCGRDARAPRKPSLCGRDARAPGKPSSHDIVTPRAQNCRSIWVPLVVEGGSSVFVSIRGSSLLTNERPFFLA